MTLFGHCLAFCNGFCCVDCECDVHAISATSPHRLLPDMLVSAFLVAFFRLLFTSLFALNIVMFTGNIACTASPNAQSEARGMRNSAIGACVLSVCDCLMKSAVGCYVLVQGFVSMCVQRAGSTSCAVTRIECGEFATPLCELVLIRTLTLS